MRVSDAVVPPQTWGPEATLSKVAAAEDTMEGAAAVAQHRWVLYDKVVTNYEFKIDGATVCW